MNLTLALVLGAAGAILILVAAIGGGFTISAVSMPPVGVAARVISFVLGGVLVFSAVGVYAMDSTVDAGSPSARAQVNTPSSPPPAGAPVNVPANSPTSPPANSRTAADVVPVVSPDGYDVKLFSDTSTSSRIVGSLSGGQDVTVLCTMQGESVTSQINGYTSSLWNGVSVGNSDTVGFLPDVYVGTDTYQPTMPNCSDLWSTSRA